METRGPASAGDRGGERGALAELAGDPSSRKRFLRMVGGTGAASALATLLSACGEIETPVGVTQRDRGTVGEFGPGDVGIVNYALTLEYMEQEFYDQARKSGEVRDRALRNLIDDAYTNESEHVHVLQRVAEQMGRPVTRPKLDFESVLEGGERRILRQAAEFENLGASAYLGQAPRIADRTVLDAALRIHTVEARQAAAFNELGGYGFRGDRRLLGSLPNGAFAEPRTMVEVLRVAGRFLPEGPGPLESPIR